MTEGKKEGNMEEDGGREAVGGGGVGGRPRSEMEERKKNLEEGESGEERKCMERERPVDLTGKGLKRKTEIKSNE